MVRAKFNPFIHRKDSDCHVNPKTNLCNECNVEHGFPCAYCKMRAYHTENCPEDGIVILNRAWNHLWFDSENTRKLGLELIVLATAMHELKTGVNL